VSVQRRNRRSRRAVPGQVLLWGALGLFGSYLLFFLVFGRMGLVAHLRLKEDAARIETEIARVGSEIDVLAAQADALGRDPHTIERIARERLGMVRPGETVFLFDSPPPASGRADAPTPPTRRP
jgi:cell division protein FtsB